MQRSIFRIATICAVFALGAFSARATPISMQLAPTSTGQAGAAIGAALGTTGAHGARGTGLSSARKTIGASATPGQGPAQGSSVSATASRTVAFTLDCAAPRPPSPASGLFSYPLGIETACMKQGAGYFVDLCPATENGGACTTNSGWIQQAITPHGTFKAGAQIQLAVGACPNDRCAITLTQTGAFRGTGASLKQQGLQAAASGLHKPSVTQSTLGLGVYTSSGRAILPGSNANSGAYLGNLLANGSAITSCIRKQKTALQGGKPVYTCSGSASVYFGGQSCKNTITCVKWQTGVVNWSSSCVVSVSQAKSTCTTITPSSATSCTSTTPVEQCTLANQAVTEKCSVGYSPAVHAHRQITCGASGTVLASWTDGPLHETPGPMVVMTCEDTYIKLTGYQYTYYDTSAPWGGTFGGSPINLGTLQLTPGSSTTVLLQDALNSGERCYGNHHLHHHVRSHCVSYTAYVDTRYTFHSAGTYVYADSAYDWNAGNSWEPGNFGSKGVAMCRNGPVYQWRGGDWYWNCANNGVNGAGLIWGGRIPLHYREIYSLTGTTKTDGCTLYGG